MPHCMPICRHIYRYACNIKRAGPYRQIWVHNKHCRVAAYRTDVINTSYAAQYIQTCMNAYINTYIRKSTNAMLRFATLGVLVSAKNGIVGAAKWATRCNNSLKNIKASEAIAWTQLLLEHNGWYLNDMVLICCCNCCCSVANVALFYCNLHCLRNVSN